MCAGPTILIGKPDARDVGSHLLLAGVRFHLSHGSFGTDSLEARRVNAQRASPCADMRPQRAMEEGLLVSVMPAAMEERGPGTSRLFVCHLGVALVIEGVDIIQARAESAGEFAIETRG